MEIHRNFSPLGEFFSSATIDERKETIREKSDRERSEENGKLALLIK